MIGPVAQAVWDRGEIGRGRGKSDVLGEIVSEREGGTGRESENGHGERKKWDG